MTIKYINFEIEDIKEIAIKIYLIRIIFLIYSLLIYLYYKYIKINVYLAVSTTLRYERITFTYGINKVFNVVKCINSRVANLIAVGNANIIKAFIETKAASKYIEEFRAYSDDHVVRLKYPKKHDNELRQGDLLVLKPHISENEKGVLFIQYNDSFQKLAALFDLSKLSKYYRLVLEPSWWGYRDSVYYLFLGLKTDVVIEAQHEDDYEYIKQLGHNIHALRLGAGDWVDPLIFNYDQFSEKIYDVVMVANWLKLKRHKVLFKAISKIKDRIERIALIGYPRGGRTIDDIKEEAKQYGILDKLVFFENISPNDVNKVIQRSRIGVMLSKREGANKGIYECLFCNVPVILSSHNIGVNRSQINRYTGIIAKDNELSDKIVYLIDNIQRFTPRAWAYENTGCMNSNRILNNMIKNLAVKCGEEWSQDVYPKKNATNAMYVDDNHRLTANCEFDQLSRYLLRY